MSQIVAALADQTGRTAATHPNGQAKKRPVIGILCTPSQADNPGDLTFQNYVNAVKAGGGMPKLLPIQATPAEEILKEVDGLLIPGGADLETSLYGQTNRFSMGMLPDFDKFEQGCIVHALKTNMPMLGVCRGQQWMNVAAGGTLIQDIEKEALRPGEWRIQHRQRALASLQGNDRLPVHGIQIAPIIEGRPSILKKLFGMNFLMVNSAHHQAVGVIAPLFAVAAWAYDGVIEAIERKDNPTQWAVQFHPERLRLVDPAWTKVFRKLAKDAREWRTNGGSSSTAETINLAVLTAEEAARRSGILRLPGNLYPPS